jgi:hypothetical protein
MPSPVDNSSLVLHLELSSKSLHKAKLTHLALFGNWSAQFIGNTQASVLGHTQAANFFLKLCASQNRHEIVAFRSNDATSEESNEESNEEKNEQIVSFLGDLLAHERTSPSQLDVALVWEMDTLRCVKTILDVPITFASTLAFDPPTGESPIRFTVHAPSKVQHDFTRGVCSVAVQLRVVNVSQADVEIQFQALLPSEKFKQAKAKASSQYLWSGVTSALFTLAPGAEHVLALNACVRRPGVYNLNRFRFNVLNESELSVQSNLQHLLSVLSHDSAGDERAAE